MMKLGIEIVTIFPAYFEGPLRESLLGKAQKKSLIKIRVHDLRQYTHDRHKTVDAKPFGGGPGMLMKPEPIFECVEAIRSPESWVVLLDPKGTKFNQAHAEALAKKRYLILISGHYEGVDHRVHEHLADDIFSVGDFITMGGEAPALCVIEAVARWVPGVLGNTESVKDESFSTGHLEYPQYTRPRLFRGYEVPEILLSGDHSKVKAWKHKQARNTTRKKRPDLTGPA